VSHAVAAWELSGGRFDPTVGAALIALGYDRDFADVARRRGPAGAGTAPGPAPGPAGIAVDRARGSITLPDGVIFDPGGIGKGLAADLAAEALLDIGALGALVNLGGDLRAAGAAPGDDGWAVSLPDPLRPGHELARFTLPHGAVATSSRLRRRWTTGARPAHHLVDPATGLPATAATVAVSVVADRAWRAEALSTSLFLGDPGEIDRHPDAHAIVVTADGRRYASPPLEATLR
jgi:thiamine biosynthesis lipoprotein